MSHSRSSRRLALCAAGLLVAMPGCRSETLREWWGQYTPHERYEALLREAALDQTALGSDWIAAAQSSLAHPLVIEAPYREESYLDPREAVAMTYRISLRNGQRLEVAFASEPDSGYQVFLDLFRAPPDSGRAPRRVLSADSLERSLDYLARRDGDYLVRVQPELLRGGRYTITVVVRPSLAFPVSGYDTTAIRSWYGDPRDAGRRRHEGLDIFAPRGTPVIAAASGVIRSIRPNNLGGRVVWLRDDEARSHYYAHLDRVLVQRGDRVTLGDTIGLVGNTGNARTTPPHLHFGLYSQGSFDPYPALYEAPSEAALFTGDGALIGQFARVNRERTRVRALPSSRSDIVAELPRHTPVRVEGGSGPWYRVTLPDGAIGYIATRLAESLDRPIGRQAALAGTALLRDPDPAAVTVDRIAEAMELEVLGAFGSFAFVQGPAGRPGWMLLE